MGSLQSLDQFVISRLSGQVVGDDEAGDDLEAESRVRPDRCSQDVNVRLEPV
jgi:hypothetical protein